jgi:uncharacterized protein (TIGR02265 family)
MAGTTKGTYFVSAIECFAKTAGSNNVKELCKKLDIPAEPRKRHEYAIALLNLFIEEGTKLFWPNTSIEKGMYRQGEEAFSGFANTLIGKTSLNLFGSHLRQLAPRAPTYYASENKFGSVKYVEVAQNNYRLEFREYESHPHYQHGLISYITLRIESKAKVELSVHNFVSRGRGEVLGDFDIVTTMP